MRSRLSSVSRPASARGASVRTPSHAGVTRGRTTRLALRRVSRLLGLLMFMTLVCVSTRTFAEDPVATGGQRSFATPDDAARAFIAALDSGSDADLRAVFGPEIDRLAATDKIAGEQEQKRLREAAQESLVLEPHGDDTVTLVLGAKRWPFPIPLVRDGGAWRFDGPAGIDELLNRRIGADELAAIGVARAYAEAQRVFAAEDREGDGVPEYARSFASTAGRHDGLYWESAPGEEASPLGPFVAAAGDYAKGRKPGDPFKGYYFRILERQGPHAPGGAHAYVINGHMIAGFALVAFPADYGTSGIMTFIVGPLGQVFEKDLGPQTARIAGAMTAYDPDSSWKPVSAGE